MDDLTKIRQFPHNSRRERKKNYRYNDSISKYKKNYPNNIHKYSAYPKEKFEVALENLKEGIEEITSEFNKSNDKTKLPIKDNISTTNPSKRYNIQKNPLTSSAPKFHFLKVTTPRRNYPLISKKRHYLDTSKSLNKSFFTTANDYKNNSVIFNADNHSIFDMNTSRLYSRPIYRRILLSKNSKNENGNENLDYLRLNSINIDNDIKHKELINMNNILQRQNKELRQNTREMRYKINDLLNNITSLRMDNQRLNSEKNKLLIQITNLENEFDINKNLSMNELELKSNQITELNEEIMRLNMILDEKENEIIALNNSNGNGINELNYMESEENNNININEYINQINALKEENEFLKNRNEENGEANNNERINILNKDNQKLKLLYNNLKNEYEKMKNYYLSMNNQKNSFEIKQNDYQKNINELNLKLNALQKENNNLKNLVNNQNSLLRNNKQNNNSMNNNEAQLQINQLLEENNMLKEQIDQNNYNNDKLSYLKNDVKEKSNEINDLNSKIKELMSQLTVSKNVSSDLSKQNIKYKKDIEQLNNKLNNLEKENINNQQQIQELNNLNNKLKIKVYSIDSGSLNFNKQMEQQLIILKQKNEELEEKLLNSNNNISQEKKLLIIENTELKNEILNLKTQINELENENHNNILQISKLDELEKQLKEAKNECQMNFNELKVKDNENKKLLDIIKNKEKENEELQHQIIQHKKLINIVNESVNEENEDKKSMNEKEEYLEKMELELAEIKKNDEEKSILIEKLNKEIEEFKSVNNKLLQENAQIKEKLQLLQNEADEGLMITLDNLKDELKDKGLQIQKLIEENNSLRNNAKNSIKKKISINKDDEDEREIDLNNRNEINPFRNTVNSAGLNDVEKVKFYKNQIKELKITNDSDQIQIKTLKADIKELKAKMKNIQTFSGQLKDFNEFLNILNRAVENYKPKKKEQKDAFNKLVEVVNNFHIE